MNPRLLRSIKCHGRVSLFTHQILLVVVIAGEGMLPARAGNDRADGIGLQMTPASKRVGPLPVAPVVMNGLRIEAVNGGRKRGLGQNGGYIEAFDQAGGKSWWLLQVYQINYAKNMEEDVQDRFIVKLESTTDGANLLVTDETGHRFEVDLANRAVRIAPAD